MGNPLPKQKVLDWELRKVIDELLSWKIINTNMIIRMHGIRKLRNSFAHEEYSLRLSPQIVEQIISSVEDIINCLTILKAEKDKWSK